MGRGSRLGQKIQTQTQPKTRLRPINFFQQNVAKSICYSNPKLVNSKVILLVIDSIKKNYFVMFV